MSESVTEVATRWRNLPPELAVEAARQDQDERWSRGDRPPAEAYLAALPRVAGSPDDALVLIYGEVMNREAVGETAHAAEYTGRFPAYADRLAAVFAVHDGFSLGGSAGRSRRPAPGATDDTPPQVPGLSGFALVGRGSVGVVYRATEQATGRAVAVKVIDEAVTTPNVLVRFLQEAEILSRLDHPNVVRFVASGAAAGRPYLVSEWVGGGTLERRIGGRPRPWVEAVRLVATVARAVHHAHERGVIHRDLKPANILLTADEEPRVADFGVARLVHTGGLLSVTGQLIGTPAYMPPEQVEGRHRDVGPASDVYALGAVLYELLTGRLPFGGPDRVEVLRRVLSDPPPPFDLAVSGIPTRVAEVCRRCLAKNPRDRLATADALVAALCAPHVL